MQITLTLRSILLTALVGLATASFGQETTTADETEAGSENPIEFSTGEPVSPDQLAIGTPYTKEVFGDWAVQCVKTDTDSDPCTMFQLIKGGEDNPLAEFSLAPIKGAGAVVAGANIVTPLETLLSAQLAIDVDGANMKQYPFVLCSRGGCLVRVGLAQTDLNTYKKGNAATVHLVNAVAPDVVVKGTLSLTGFTAAFNAISQ